MRKRAQAGFTLIELIVAMSLVSLVLVSLVSISASMVRFQMEGIRKGGVTGGSLMSFNRLSKDVQDANVLAYPSPGATPSTLADNTLVLCTNWSRLISPNESGSATGGRLNTIAAGVNADQVQVIYYCLDTTNHYLRRYVNRGTPAGGVYCPNSSGFPTSLPACDGSGAWSEAEVLATNVYALNSASLFSRDPATVPSGMVWVRYVVGDVNSTEKYKVPVFVPFDFRVSYQRQAANTTD